MQLSFQDNMEMCKKKKQIIFPILLFYIIKEKAVHRQLQE